MDDQPILISLVLATYGRTDDIGRLVGSLVAQSCKRFELIFVDQNLDERVSPYVQQARLTGIAVQHLRMDKPNLSKARNVGLRAAQGIWVAFPDDDCWYEHNAMDIVASAPAEGVDAWVLGWAEQEALEGNPVGDGPFELAVWRDFRGGDASSITLVFRREIAVALGGFDEKLGVGQWFGAGEETDFVLCALAAGARIERLPAAKVHHRFELPGTAGAQVPTWRATLARSRGTGALYAKHKLAAFVVLRGLFGPVSKALLMRPDAMGLKAAFATSLGRAQGWWCWR
jgi:glycosyltransferase involved in cell wall biosynthesis